MFIGDEFKPLIIKDYRDWALVLSKKQFYIGRCYAWWKDKPPGEGEHLRPSEISSAARDELWGQIFEDVILACKALGYSTEPYGEEFLLNEAYFANEVGHNHHLHHHFIPRTKNPFGVRLLHHEEVPNMRLVMEDPQWGHNYAGPERTLPPDQLHVVRQIMVHALQ